jgi:CheY-like chemotaxis protein
MLARTDYQITEAENGEEALSAIAKQRPDLILMDIQLPIMDGYTAVSRIKADPALRSIPIIAVTSYRACASFRNRRLDPFRVRRRVATALLILSLGGVTTLEMRLPMQPFEARSTAATWSLHLPVRASTPLPN